MFNANNFIIGGFAQSISLGYYNNGLITGGGPFGSGNAISIGNNAAQFSQGSNAIAIGQNAGQYSQGQNAIAIGNNAGMTLQKSGSIILNASGNVITSNKSYACYINPIQDNSSSTRNCLLTYNTTSYELNYNSSFRCIPWRDCGYTVVAGSDFGGLITATTTAPTPAAGSSTTCKYSVIGNTMFLQFTYSNNTSVIGGAGSGVYLYNLPSGFSLNTNLIQTVGSPTDSTSANVYGTTLGKGVLEYLPGNAGPNTGLNSLIYSDVSGRLADFFPAYCQGSINIPMRWHGGTYFNYANNYNHYSFNASFSVN